MTVPATVRSGHRGDPCDFRVVLGLNRNAMLPSPVGFRMRDQTRTTPTVLGSGSVRDPAASIVHRSPSTTTTTRSYKTAATVLVTIINKQQDNYKMLLHALLLLLALLNFSSAGTNEEGLAFLQANKDKEGVVELPSGLQYKILKQGHGAFHPAVGTPCSCHYAGTLIDGTPFDSSYDRGEPTTFAPNQVIKGWTEAMQLMVEGDKWELYIPSDMAYGDRGSPPKIPGGSVLVFTIEILEILGDEVRPALRCQVASGEGCNEKELAYIEKCKAWDLEKQQSELKRINGMMHAKATAQLSEWMHRRVSILQQLVDDESTSSGKAAEDEL